MPTLHFELIGNVNLYVGILIKIVSGIIMGAIIGIDRERKLKSAGIKTMVLICMGATLFTTISILGGAEVTRGDSLRIPAQIVSGIGFLGAGAIFQSKGNIIGLTTAALIWFTAAIGVTIGIGYPFTALGFTLFAFGVLRIIDPIYRLFDLNIYFHLEVLGRGALIGRLEEIIDKKSLLKINEEVIDKRNDMRLLQIYVRTNPKRLKAMLSDIHEIIQVKEVHYQILKEKPNLESVEDA
ncbi:MAG: MgtC/SapB family protein [Bacteriovoracaceae bacterium]